MRNPKCRTCGKEHALGGCPEFKSTAARKDVQAITASLIDGDAIDARSQKPLAAGTQALPVDTNLIVGVDPASKDFGAKVIGRVMEDGRIEILSLTHSKAQFNKAEYQRQYMADQRTIKRLGLNCTVKEYRLMNEGAAVATKEWREKNG